MSTSKTSDVSHQLKMQGLQETLLKECRVMMNYCLSNGKHVDPGHVRPLEKQDKNITAEELMPVYNYLSMQVKPASPGTLVLFEKSRQSKALFKFLGPLPIVRRFMWVTIFSLIALILFSLSPHVNVMSIQLSMLQGSGWDQVQRLAFLLACASVGASFYALFKMNTYINDGTFDMKYSATYWSRFVLGLVAGILLSEMFVVFIDSGIGPANPIPPNLGSGGGMIPTDSTSLASDSTAVAANVPAVQDTTSTIIDRQRAYMEKGLDESGPLSSAQYLLKPILAILGGFSANLVYRILNRLIESVESLFKGSAEEVVKQQQMQMAMQNMENENMLKNNTAQQLLALKNDLISGDVPKELLANVDKAIGGLVTVPGGLATEVASPAGNGDQETDAPSAPEDAPVAEVAPTEPEPEPEATPEAEAQPEPEATPKKEDKSSDEGDAAPPASW